MRFWNFLYWLASLTGNRGARTTQFYITVYDEKTGRSYPVEWLPNHVDEIEIPEEEWRER